MRVNASKFAFIYQCLFFSIGTFQRLTAEKNKKFLRLRDCGDCLNAIPFPCPGGSMQRAFDAGAGRETSPNPRHRTREAA
jgi:hypothetical protein